MILSDREIIAALTRDAIRITPDPTLDPDVWSATALDLRLHSQFTYWALRKGKSLLLRPGEPDYDYNAMIEKYGKQIVAPAEGHKMQPGDFLLGWTIEKLQLPYRSRIAARVEGKSSLARLGLGVHVTAPTIHAGFGVKSGEPDYPGSAIQLEIWNCGPLSVVLKPGMRICQLIFEWVDGTPDKGYTGRFSVQGPQAPAGAR